MIEDRDKLAISALQHFRFCKRQFALIHIEQLWSENHLTAEGRLLHEKRMFPQSIALRNKIVKAMPLASEVLGIYGVADTVEIFPDGTPFPVEYKHGRPNPHGSDEIQLCAQALCLEEMTKKNVPDGALLRKNPSSEERCRYGRTSNRNAKIIAEARAMRNAAIRRLRFTLLQNATIAHCESSVFPVQS